MIDGPKDYKPIDLVHSIKKVYGGDEYSWLASLRQARADEVMARDLWIKAMGVDEMFEGSSFEEFKSWLATTSFDQPWRDDDGTLDEPFELADITPEGMLSQGPDVARESVVQQVQLPAEMVRSPATARALDVGEEVYVVDEVLEQKAQMVTDIILEAGGIPGDATSVMRWYRDVAGTFGVGDVLDMYLDGARKGMLSEEEEAEVVAAITEDVAKSVMVELARTAEALGARAQEVDELLSRVAQGDVAAQQQLAAAMQDPIVKRYVDVQFAAGRVKDFVEGTLTQQYGKVFEDQYERYRQTYDVDAMYRLYSSVPVVGPVVWSYKTFIRPAAAEGLRFFGNVAATALMAADAIRREFKGSTYGVLTDLREWVSRVTDPERYWWLATPVSEAPGVVRRVAKVDDTTYLALDGRDEPIYAMRPDGTPLPFGESVRIADQFRGKTEDLEKTTKLDWDSVLPTAVSGLTQTYLIATLARGLRMGGLRAASGRASIVGATFMSSYNSYYEEALRQLGPLRALDASRYAFGAALGEGLVETLNPLELAIVRPRPAAVARRLRRALSPGAVKRMVAPSPGAVALARFQEAVRHGALEGVEGAMSTLWAGGVASIVNAAMPDATSRLDEGATFVEMLNGAVAEALGGMFAGGTVAKHPGATHLEALMLVDRDRAMLDHIGDVDSQLRSKVEEVLRRADAIGRADGPRERAEQLLQAHGEVVLGLEAERAKERAKAAADAAAPKRGARPSLAALEAKRMLFLKGRVGTSVETGGGVTYELVRVQRDDDGAKYVVRVDGEANIVLDRSQYVRLVEDMFDSMVLRLYGDQGMSQARQVRKRIGPAVEAAMVGALSQEDVDQLDDEGDFVLTYGRDGGGVDLREVAQQMSYVFDAPQVEAILEDGAAQVGDRDVQEWALGEGREVVYDLVQRIAEGAGVEAPLSQEQALRIGSAMVGAYVRGERPTPDDLYVALAGGDRRGEDAGDEPKGIDVGLARAVVQQFGQSVGLGGVEVRVVRHYEEVDERHRQQVTQQQFDAAEGFYVTADRVVYVNATNIDDADRLRQVLLHEVVAHHGLRAAFGSSLESALLSVSRDPALARRITAHGRLLGFDMRTRRGRAMATEEMLARLAERGVHMSLVQRVYAAMRAGLRRAGVVRSYSDKDLLYEFLLPASAAVRRESALLRGDAGGAEAAEEVLMSLRKRMSERWYALKRRELARRKVAAMRRVQERRHDFYSGSLSLMRRIAEAELYGDEERVRQLREELEAKLREEDEAFGRALREAADSVEQAEERWGEAMWRGEVPMVTLGDAVAEDFAITQERPAGAGEWRELYDNYVSPIEHAKMMWTLMTESFEGPADDAVDEEDVDYESFVVTAQRAAKAMEELTLGAYEIYVVPTWKELPIDMLMRLPTDVAIRTKAVVWGGALHVVHGAYSEAEMKYILLRDAVMRHGLIRIFGEEVGEALDRAYRHPALRRYVERVEATYPLKGTEQMRRRAAAHLAIVDMYMDYGRTRTTFMDKLSGYVVRLLRKVGVRIPSQRDIVEEFVLPSMMKYIDDTEVRDRFEGDANALFSVKDGARMPDAIDVDGRRRPTRNSEGELIHDTVAGIRNFWRWFGDSKVVDEQGRPLVVYHGGTFNPLTDGVFKTKSSGVHFGTKEAAIDRLVFKGIKLNSYTVIDDFGNIVSKSPYDDIEDTILISKDFVFKFDTSGYDHVFADAVYFDKPVFLHGYYLNIRNHVEYEDGDGAWFLLVRDARRRGFDGIKYVNHVEDPGSTSWIIFHPDQAKIARGNSGAFSPSSYNVLFSERPRFEALDDMIDVDGAMRPTKDSTGRQIHLNAEGVRSFWRWFGDSKVVDEQGRPLVLYHGTFYDFDRFALPDDFSNLFFGPGLYFTDSEYDAFFNYANRITAPDFSAKVSNAVWDAIDSGELQYVVEELGLDVGEERAEELLYELLRNPSKGSSVAWRIVFHYMRISGENIMPVYVRMEDPLVLDTEDRSNVLGEIRDVERWTDAIMNAMHDVGFDPHEDAHVISDFLERMLIRDYGDTGDGTNLDIFKWLMNAVHEFFGGNYAFVDFAIRHAGHDGVIGRNMHLFLPGFEHVDFASHYVVFKPNQVKSAIGNRGTFSDDHANILFSKVPPKAVEAIKAASALQGEPSVAATTYRHLREGSGLRDRVVSVLDALYGRQEPDNPIEKEIYDEGVDYYRRMAEVAQEAVDGDVSIGFYTFRRFDRPTHVRTLALVRDGDVGQGLAHALSLTYTVMAPRWHGGTDVVRVVGGEAPEVRKLYRVYFAGAGEGFAEALAQRVNRLVAVAAKAGKRLDVELVGWRTSASKGVVEVAFHVGDGAAADAVIEQAELMGVRVDHVTYDYVGAIGHSMHTDVRALMGRSEALDAVARMAMRRARARMDKNMFLERDPFVTNMVMAARVVDSLRREGVGLDDAYATAAALTGVDEGALSVFMIHASDVVELRHRIAGKLVRVPLLGRLLNALLRHRAALPEEVRHVDALRRGAREWALRRAAAIAKRMNAAFGDDEWLREVAARYMEGTIALDEASQLTREQRDVLDEARDAIDGLSYVMLLGNGTSSPAVLDNIGKHLSRIYGIFLADDRGGLEAMLSRIKGRPSVEDYSFDKLDEGLQDAVVEEMVALRGEAYAKEYKKDKPSMPFDRYAAMRAEEEVRIILNEYQVKDFSSRAHSDDKVSIDTGLLRRRKELPPALREAMGEVEDVVARFYFTVYRMSSMAYNAIAMKTIALMGAGRYLFNPSVHKGIPHDYTYPIAPDGSEAWRPLAGWVTSKAIRDDLRDAMRVARAHGDWVYGLLRRAAAFINWHNTVGSIPTQMRNFVGNFEFVMNMGWLSPRAWADAGRAFFAEEGRARELFDVALQFDLVDQNIDMRIIRELTQERADVVFRGVVLRDRGVDVSAAVKLLQMTKEAMNGLYRFGDDLFKLIGLAIELDRYAWALYDSKYFDLDGAKRAVVRNYAAVVVQSVLPNYNAIGKLQRQLAVTPFIGQFTTFQFEAMRTFHNYITLNAAHISKGGRFAVLALRRLAWGLTYRGVRAGIAVAIAKSAYMMVAGWMRHVAHLMGGGGEEDEDVVVEAIRLMLPPWADNRLMVPIAWDGYRLMLYDMNSVEPWARAEELVNIVSDRPPSQWGDHVLQLFADLFSPTILMNEWADVAEIWDEYQSYPTSERVKNIVAHMATHLQGTYRAVDSAMRKTETIDEATRKLLLKSFGINTYIVDPVVYVRRRINELFDYQHGRVVLIKQQAKRDMLKTPDEVEREKIRLKAQEAIIGELDRLRRDIDVILRYVDLMPDEEASLLARRTIEGDISERVTLRERTYLNTGRYRLVIKLKR